MAAAVVVAVILVIVFTRSGGGSASAELFAEPAAAAGPNPVTESTANESSAAPSVRPVKPSQGTNTRIPGSMPGLYGGTEHTASCDVEKQIKYLESQPAKRQAFAGALDKAPGDIPSYLRSMTPVQLGYDTRVTNHGYKDGEAYPFQAVLQAGTAVLVDSYGVPRVRCMCGNPLTEPEPLAKGAKTTGQTWPGYQPSNAVVITPANSEIQEFTLRNPKTGQWFKRPRGDINAAGDHSSAPPKETPSGPPSSMRPYGPPSPGETAPGYGTTEPGTPPPGGSSPPGGGTGGGSSSEGGTTPETPSVPSEGTTGGGSSTGGETPGGSSSGGSTPGGSSPGGGSSGSGSQPGGGGQTPAPAT